MRSKVSSISTLPLGEKIKQIRTSQKLSQLDIANAIDSNTMHVSRIERGQTECAYDQLCKIKKALNVEGAPLTESEAEIFKSRLWLWNEVMTANRLHDANTMQEELSLITRLPFEKDLVLLYTMLDIRLLNKKGDIVTAQSRLEAVENEVKNSSIEIRNLFHRNMGYVCTWHPDWKSALAHYIKASKLESDDLKTDAQLLYGLGRAYFTTGKPFHALSYFERAYKEYRGDSSNTMGPNIITELATCYMATGRFSKAKGLLTTSLAHARSQNDEINIIMCLVKLGIIYNKLGQHDEGLNYIEQAVMYIKPIEDISNDTSFVAAERTKLMNATILYNKAALLLDMKKHPQCMEVLEQGKSLAEGVPQFNMMFDALMCAINLKKRENRQYIETVVIPFIKNSPEVYTALEYCELLEAYYRKHSATKKAYEIAAIAKEIYKNMLYEEDSAG
ncbi:MAG: helix-turn-helix transcriptional regulator [Defluviitaleaceae bacterium]|nr:helix-turn-helix transcriptional regulator [Defluviitaleaceae bacterium]